MKDFILYPEALELKELGFEEPCFAYFNRDTKSLCWHSNSVEPYNHNDIDRYGDFSAPTYSQAFRWFREKYNLDLSINTVYTGYNELTTKNYSAVVDDCGSFTNVGFYKTYEEAELACLKKLIEIVKERRN